MSGSNPFRRSKLIAEAQAYPPVPNSDAITHHVGITDDHQVESSLRQKTVRIASPPAPTSPTDSISYFSQAPTRAVGTHRGSPPPLESYDSTSSNEFTTDPFNPGSSGNDHGAEFEVAEALSSGSNGRGAAWNKISSNTLSPLRMTSMDPTFSLNAEAQSSGNLNVALDVDAFTRLLLTGDAGKQPETTAASKANLSGQTSHFNPGLESDSSSSSNPDNAFISRQSGTPHLAAGVHTPHTSHDTSTSDIDDMRSDSRSQSTFVEKKSKPPLPKTRHGKLIKPQDPSTAPHERGDEAPPSSSQAHLQSSPSDASGSISSGNHQYPSSPPFVKSSPTISDDAATTDESASLRRALSLSKRPPTPPLTRRHSQMKHPNKASSKDRPHRISLPPGGLGLQATGPTSPIPKTPPRPPSRRYDKSLGPPQSDSFSQPRSPLSQDYTIPSGLPPTDESQIGAPSPPSHIPSVKRTPPSSTISGSAMPPPPPPPRRIRASSKSSTSSAYPTSMQSDREEERADDIQPKASNAEGILADLTRLQREVDDLRGHYEGRKASH